MSCWLVDSLGAIGASLILNIHLESIDMPREINNGTLLNDGEGKTGSDDLLQLLERTNTLLNYYGLPAKTFTLSTKHFHTWLSNINVLREGVEEINRKIGKSTVWVQGLNNGPSAKVINQIIETLPTL